MDAPDKPPEKPAPSEPVTITLRKPVQLGKSGELIEEITLRPTAKLYRNYEMQMTEDGKFIFRPYELAKIGILMAGQQPILLDQMDPADMQEVAIAVMGFLGTGLRTGPTSSLQ